TQTVTGLTAGTYCVTITDTGPCTATACVEVTQPTAITATATQGTAIACNGGTTTVTVSASGGTPGYSGTGPFTKSAGSYTFTVTDTKGCTASTTITITQPDGLTITCGGTNESCNGVGGDGSASVTATGGTTGYTYKWSNSS